VKPIDGWLNFIGVIAFATLFVCMLVVSGWFLLPLLAFTYSLQNKWRVRCPQCFGTGICCDKPGHFNPGYRGTHSCCGDCKRTTVPCEQVPSDYTYRDGDAKVLIGVGWVLGNLWARLWFGGPCKQLGIQK
jgi:hypothetical protein